MGTASNSTLARLAAARRSAMAAVSGRMVGGDSGDAALEEIAHHALADEAEAAGD
jgi:uncharacterized protein YciI